MISTQSGFNKTGRIYAEVREKYGLKQVPRTSDHRGEQYSLREFQKRRNIRESLCYSNSSGYRDDFISIKRGIRSIRDDFRREIGNPNEFVLENTLQKRKIAEKLQWVKQKLMLPSTGLLKKLQHDLIQEEFEACTDRWGGKPIGFSIDFQTETSVQTEVSTVYESDLTESEEMESSLQEDVESENIELFTDNDENENENLELNGLESTLTEKSVADLLVHSGCKQSSKS